MNLDATGLGLRSTAGMAAGASVLSLFSSAPEWLRGLASVAALALANLFIEWVRLKHAQYKQKRQELEADDDIPMVPRDDSRAGFVNRRMLLVLAALALAACGGRYFLRVFAHETLGKCVASGYERDFQSDPGFTSRTGALQCIAPIPAANHGDVGGFLFDEHLKDAAPSVDAVTDDVRRVVDTD